MRKNESSSKPKTIDSWLREAVRTLHEAGIDSARLDSLLLLEHVLKSDRTFVLAHSERTLNDVERSELEDLLAKRRELTPLAYLVGHKEFYGLPLYVNKDVMLPRPETEELVQHVIDRASNKQQVLDIGTGSGAIALAIAHSRPDLNIHASDISGQALSVAKRNAFAYGLDINFTQSDLFSRVETSYDIIAANLPYVSERHRTKLDLKAEPPLALFAGMDGLDTYRRFLHHAPLHLNPYGWLIIEHDPQQFNELESIGTSLGFKVNQISNFVSTLEPR